jgi:2-dehydro-3-deoxy-D-arabinonate dehydratase
MKLARYYLPGYGRTWGVIVDDRVHPVAAEAGSGFAFLAALLQWPDPAAVLRSAVSASSGSISADLLLDPQTPNAPSDSLSPQSWGAGGADPTPNAQRSHLLPPIDHQEVWAAGVTYQRSKVARMAESEGAARFYDLVYDADRPELFLKATPARVCATSEPLRIRRDAKWNVPEPEVALLLSPEMRIVGYTIGNDMSSRDIEGENPLYLPQAKVYRQSCALGPVIWIEEEPREHREMEVRISIERQGAVVFAGETSTARMKRQFGDLATWLGRDNHFPSGAFLLTGTGIVPGDDFTLAPGDVVTITVPEIGVLRNPVVQG